MSEDNLELTESEKVAKNFVFHVLLNGLKTSEPCDTHFSEDIFKLPVWYDDAKFKRGQKYFMDNRACMMLSNFYGLFALICEPNGARILDRTNQSSTPDTAKKRYIQTSLHMLSWYEEELKPGSKSWESLKKVRKMHLCASRAAEKDTEGYKSIPQATMSVTVFGFMGFALVKPHQLGIKCDNDEDREAFVHFWAVIGSMLGIKDEFNMCLLPLDVVGIICHIYIRYYFFPLLQLETPIFKKLATAIVDGLFAYAMFPTYESRLFLAKRLVGIPGYQYNIDDSKEYFIRQVFTQNELNLIRENYQNFPGFEYRRNFIGDEKIRALEIKKIKGENYQEVPDDKLDNDFKYMMKLLDLKHPSELKIIDLDDATYKKHLNDKKFHEMSFKERMMVKMNLDYMRRHQNRFIKPLHEAGLSVVLYIMKKKAKNF